MQLKPFRSFDEYDVINLYSLAQSSGNAGDLVEFLAWNPSSDDGYSLANGLEAFGGMTIKRYINAAQVTLAGSGNDSNVAGMLLWDVRETDPLGRKYIYDPQSYYEHNVVTSGQTVPIVRRGMFLVTGFTGTPGPGSGIGVSNNGNGQWTVLHPTAFTPGVTGAYLKQSLGRFLSSTGADGSAFAFLDIK